MEILYDGIILGSKRERESPNHFSNGQVPEDIVENPPPAECPSNVLVVPESPHTDSICPVTAEFYHITYPLSTQSRTDWLGGCTTAH